MPLAMPRNCAALHLLPRRTTTSPVSLQWSRAPHFPRTRRASALPRNRCARRLSRPTQLDAQ
eukprot:718311-Lingulodinium_polyedra.AAC.1